MAIYQRLRPDGRALAIELAAEALRSSRSQTTSRPGSVYIPNGDGTGTMLGPAVSGSAGGVAPFVGDTTPPGRPTGCSCSSAWGTVYCRWDGTLEGGVPADFAYVAVSVGGSEMGRMAEAGVLALDGYEDGTELDVSFVAYDAARDRTGALAPNASEATVVHVTVVDARAEIDQAVQDASDKADALAQQVTHVETTVDGVQQDVTELTTKVSGAVDTANEALTAASSAQQDVNGFKTTVEQTYQTKDAADAAMAQEVLDRNSAIEQSAASVMTQVSESYVNNETGATYATKTELQQASDQVLTTVESEYQSKDGMSSYYTKTEVDQKNDAITSTVSDVSKTADGAMQKATTVEQTAEGLEVTLTETTTTANSALSTANAAKTAAASAQTAANDAAKTATNYLRLDSAGLCVGNQTAASLGRNVLITNSSVQVRGGSTVYSEFGEDSMKFLETVREAVIEMMAGLCTITGSINDKGAGLVTIAANKGGSDSEFPRIDIRANGTYPAAIGAIAQANATGDTNYGSVYINAGEIQLPQGNITTADLYEAVGGWERGY